MILCGNTLLIDWECTVSSHLLRVFHVELEGLIARTYIVSRNAAFHPQRSLPPMLLHTHTHTHTQSYTFNLCPLFDPDHSIYVKVTDSTPPTRTERVYEMVLGGGGLKRDGTLPMELQVRRSFCFIGIGKAYWSLGSVRRIRGFA